MREGGHFAYRSQAWAKNSAHTFTVKLEGSGQTMCH